MECGLDRVECAWIQRLLVPEGDDAAFARFLCDTGYEHHEESGNPAYMQFLQPEPQSAKAVDPVG